MKQEYEIIHYTDFRHASIFINDIVYRNLHFHDETEMILVLEGSGVIQIDSTSFSAQKDDIFVIDSNEMHGFDCGDHLLCLIIQISSRFLEDYIPEFGHIRFNVSKPDDTDGWIKRRMQETALAYLKKKDLYSLRTISGISDILLYLYENLPCTIAEEKQDKERLSRMRRWREYIDTNADTAITLKSLAKEEELTDTHMSHLFHEYFGITFQDYLNNVRFENALTLLGSTDLSVYDLALSAGFSDPKYLNVQFQKHFGCTVKEYRRKHVAEKNRQCKVRLFEHRYPSEDAIRFLENIAGETVSQ